MRSGTIRTAGPGDLDGILDLYTHMHETDTIVDRESLDRVYREILCFPGYFFFILEDEGIFISSCILHILPNLTRGACPYGLIENVVTRTEYRGREYATRLLVHALQTAWNAGFYKVMLLTGRTDPAVFRLYEQQVNQGILEK